VIQSGQGRLGFRDFPNLLTAKENRNGSRQTLPIQSTLESGRKENLR
jgi:hypothetical protein